MGEISAEAVAAFVAALALVATTASVFYLAKQTRAVAEQIPDSNSAEPWDHYCRSTLRSSPVLRDLVLEHPTWWPYLPPLLPPAPPA